MGKQSGTSLFDLDDFRPYLRGWAQAKGRGEMGRIARELKIHTTLVSQVMSGRKCFTEEQAARLCGYMGLNALETDYFMKLVQIERAGTDELATLYRRHLASLGERAREIKDRMPESKSLTERNRAIYYSSWHYALIRLLTSIDSFQTPEAISGRLDISVSRVREILSFLVSRGLCEERPDGRFVRTAQNTHVEARFPFAVRHHQNWRAKAIELHERLRPTDLAFTAPISLASNDIPRIREKLLEAIAEIGKRVKDSPAEEVAYLGIDWIRL